jgi:lysophospholipase L1-like esterase
MNIFGRNSIICDETVVFVKSGSIYPHADLLFDVNEILRVCDTSGKVFYERGKDYEIQGRRVYLLNGSRLPFIENHQMFPYAGKENSIPLHIDGKRNLLFSEGRLFPDLQPRFTYRCADFVKSPPMTHAGKLCRIEEYLKKGRDFTLTVFGDSISAGANATKLIGIPPHLPPYGEQLVCELENSFGVKINFFNESVGGKCSNWGLESIDRVVRHKPDFVILAWGMNDASLGVKPENFGKNIKKMMQKLRNTNKKVEFLLVSTMCGNPNRVSSNAKMYREYRNKLVELCANGVALADITSVWEFMLERKKFIDITGNGVNHPNDFGHLIYKNVIFATLSSTFNRP